MDMNQYLDVFIDESKEHLQTCNEKLLLLEKDPTDLQLVHDIFRAAHTLKGMSATMGYTDLAHLTHLLENVLDAIRNGDMAVTPDWLDILFEALDHLEAMVQSIIDGGDGKRDISEVSAKLDVNGTHAETAATAELAEAQNSASDWEYDEFERTVIQEAEEQGFKRYEVKISLNENCMLKAVRVYMVFEKLNEIGEVAKTIPSAEVLETEDFGTDFQVCFLTHQSVEEIEQLINGVSEIEHVEVIQGAPLTSAEKPEESKPADLPAPVPVKQEKQKQPAKNEEQAKHTAGGSKTIRVNIERLDSLMNLFEELVIDRGRLEQIAKELEHNELTETVERMTRISGDLQSIILNMRMVPVETVFNRFPRMIRQLQKS